MDKSTHYKEIALALRAFFSSSTALEMKNSFSLLPAEIVSHTYPDPEWEQTEYAFNRLFVGPDIVVAPLFASVYLEGDGVLMSETTLNLRSLMQELHIAVPNEGSIPEDFLPFELDVLLYIDALLVEHADNTQLCKGLHEARTWLMEHLQTWVPLLIQRVHESGEMPAPLAQVVNILEDWLLCFKQQSKV